MDSTEKETDLSKNLYKTKKTLAKDTNRTKDGIFFKKEVSSRKQQKEKMEKQVDVHEKIQEGYVRAILIVEVLGRPPEHVTQALNTVLTTMKQDKELVVLRQKTYRPKKAIDSTDLFTAFMEVEVLAKGLIKLFGVCLDYMPSSVEIIEPANMKLSAAEANTVVNDLASRLHKFGEIAKRLNMEKQILQEKLSTLLQGQPIIQQEEVKLEIGKKDDVENVKEEKKQ